MKYLLTLAAFALSAAIMSAQENEAFLERSNESPLPRLTIAGADHLASLALRCVGQEYPNHIVHYLADETDIAAPQALHPAFFGCFDWHSSVHGHWMLIRLLKEFPDLPDASEIRNAIDQNLTPEKIAGELAYFQPHGRASFERTYGWAWLLKLSQELHTREDPQGQRWADTLQPLVDHIETLYIGFLPRQTYPVRTGVHPNTAFGLSFAWDYAAALDRQELKAAIQDAAQRYYAQDTNYPAHYEPSGTDFLSPCLEEANLMQRLLEPQAFNQWFDAFLPRLPSSLSTPATVTDRTDGHLVHLDGLNLSRAWCLAAIAAKLPEDDPRKSEFASVATHHIEVTLPNIASGSYEGEHWLASFAVYALSVAGK